MKLTVNLCRRTWGSPETKIQLQCCTPNTYRFFGWRYASPHQASSAQGERVEQIVFYDWGLGTEADKYLSAITGAGIDKNIQDCYRFLVHNYEKDDELFFDSAVELTPCVRWRLLQRWHKHRAADLIPRAYSMYRRRGKSASPNSLISFKFSAACTVMPTAFRISFIGVCD